MRKLKTIKRKKARRDKKASQKFFSLEYAKIKKSK